jgi:dTDP-glucose 4,6-dehydratase
MKILVTGAAGFIGSNFVRYWVGRHPDDDVVAYDVLTYAGDRRNLDGLDVEFVEGDITDAELAEQTLRDKEVEVVVNFAAESHNSLAVVDPGRFFHTNVLGTQRMLEAGRQSGVARFHHVSTCEVYGDLPLDTDEKFTEETPYRPRTPYNASKAGADHAVRAYYETYGLPVTITNCSNNYGPYQFPEKVIPLFVTNAIDDIPVPLYGDGLHVRDWLHVTDHCRALDLIIDRGTAGEVYNIGGGNEVANIELTAAILNLLGKPESLIQPVLDRPGHDRRYALDTTKISKLGWKARINFLDGLRGTVAWYRENEWWWRPIKEKDAAFRAYYQSQYGDRRT